MVPENIPPPPPPPPTSGISSALPWGVWIFSELHITQTDAGYEFSSCYMEKSLNSIM